MEAIKAMDTLDSARTISGVTKNAGCPEHNLEPRIHMMKDLSDEKLEAKCMTEG